MLRNMKDDILHLKSNREPLKSFNNDRLKFQKDDFGCIVETGLEREKKRWGD